MVLWAIKYVKKQDIYSSSSSDVFTHDRIVALVNGEEAVDAKMEACLKKQEEMLQSYYVWIKNESQNPIATSLSPNHVCEMSFTLAFANKVDRYEFTAHPLSIEDEYKMCKCIDIEDIKASLGFLGFQNSIAALGQKNIEQQVLWPLLFLQFKEHPEAEWRDSVLMTLEKLKNKVEVWASEVSYYCKYGGMDNDDHYCGLSLDIATANRKLLAATRHDRGDMADEVDEGTATKPACLQLFPDGGSYVLTARTIKLSDTNGVMRIVRNLKKTPAAAVISLLQDAGYSQELSALPQKLKTTANLSRPVIRLVKGDNEGVRRILQQLATEGAPSKKRKVTEIEITNNGEIPVAAIKKVMSKLKATQEQAMKYLHQVNNNADDAIFRLNLRLYQEGYIEDV